MEGSLSLHYMVLMETKKQNGFRGHRIKHPEVEAQFYRVILVGIRAMERPQQQKTLIGLICWLGD